MTLGQKLFCADCGESLPDAWISQPTCNFSCPICDSGERLVKIAVHDELSVALREQIRAKMKDDSLPSKKKVRKEIVAGDDYRKSRGDWVYKKRVIDRDNDLYIEKISDLTTGEVIRDIREPLSKHWGHGSDKPKQ